MNLIEFIVIAALFVVGIIFMEYEFAKTNITEEEQNQDDIHRVLKKMGADKISCDGKGWFYFTLEDEILWINAKEAPRLEVFLQNTIEGCSDVDVAQQVALEVTCRLAGGRVIIKDGNIYFGWESTLAGEDALEKGLPIILGYLAQVREKYVSAYWEALASKNHDINKLVS